MSKEYFLATGDKDEERQEIINGVYNPNTMQFLIKCGLKPGMKVLNYSCKTGYSAIELAKIVGKSGKVIAIDASDDSLKTAAKNLNNRGIDNIEFKLCNIENITTLNTEFDFIYGRWGLLFSRTPEEILKQMQTLLKVGGVLVSEELNFAESGMFSQPHDPLANKYPEIVLANSLKANLELNLANKLYSLFVRNKLNNIKIVANQPILVTSQEKSLFRLSLLSMEKTIIDNSLYTHEQLLELIEKFKILENNSNVIIGGYRNIIVSGTKT